MTGEMETDHEQALPLEKSRLFYGRIKHAWIGVLVIIAIMLAIFHPPLEIMLVFVLAATIIQADLHVYNIRAYHAADHSGDGTWLWRASFISLLAGLVVGALPIIYLDTGSSTMTYAITTILVVAMFASSVVNGPVLRAHLCWSIASTLPTTMMLLQPEDDTYHMLGWMILSAGIPVSIFLNLLIARDLNRYLESSIARDHMSRRLEEQKQDHERQLLDQRNSISTCGHASREKLNTLLLQLGACTGNISELERVALANRARRLSVSLSEDIGSMMSRFEIEHAPQTIMLTDIDLIALLANISVDFRSACDERSIELVTDLEPISVRSDRQLLSLIIHHLISRSIHNHPTYLSIRCRRCGEHLCIDIIDDGGRTVSDSHDEQDGSPSSASEHDIQIVEQICGSLGHELLIEHNDTENRSTLRCKSTPGAVDRHEDGNGDDTLTGITLIYIDDEPDSCDIMRTLFRQWGCQSRIMSSIHDLSGIDTEEPGLIVIDHDVSSERLESLIGACEGLPGDYPVLIITSEAVDEQTRSSSDRSIRYLSKPIDAMKLKRALIDESNRSHS